MLHINLVLWILLVKIKLGQWLALFQTSVCFRRLSFMSICFSLLLSCWVRVLTHNAWRIESVWLVIRMSVFPAFLGLWTSSEVFNWAVTAFIALLSDLSWTFMNTWLFILLYLGRAVCSWIIFFLNRCIIWGRYIWSHRFLSILNIILLYILVNGIYHLLHAKAWSNKDLHIVSQLRQLVLGNHILGFSLLDLPWIILLQSAKFIIIISSFLLY